MIVAVLEHRPTTKGVYMSLLRDRMSRDMERRGRGPEWKGVHIAALMFLYRRTLGKPEMVSFLAICS